MNISGLLETIIALAALFWLVTTACSFLLEAFHAMSNLRGNALRSFVVEMVGFDKTGSGPSIGKQVMDHPLIKSLYKPTAGSTDSNGTLPSYIPADLFSRTLIDVVIRQGKPSVNDLRRGVNVAITTDASDSFKDFLKAIPFQRESGKVGVNSSDEQPAWDFPAIRDWITGGLCGLFDDAVASIPSDDSLAMLLFPAVGSANSSAETPLVEVVRKLSASIEGKEIAGENLQDALARSRVLGAAGREYATSLSSNATDYQGRILTIVEAWSRFAGEKANEADQLLGSNLVEDISSVYRLVYWTNSCWFLRQIRRFARFFPGSKSHLANLGSPIDLAPALVGILGTLGRQPGDLSIEGLRKVLSDSTILPADLVATLRPLLDNADQDLDRFRTAIENWFSASMDRASGWFKRKSMLFLFCIGGFVSLIYNLDAIDITKALLSQPLLRRQGADVGRTILRDPKGMEVWPQQKAYLSLSGELKSSLERYHNKETEPKQKNEKKASENITPDANQKVDIAQEESLDPQMKDHLEEDIKAKLKRLLPTLARDGELALLGDLVLENKGSESPLCKDIARRLGEEIPCDSSSFWSNSKASWDPDLAKEIATCLKAAKANCLEKNSEGLVNKLNAANAYAKAMTSATTEYLGALPGVGPWLSNGPSSIGVDGVWGWIVKSFSSIGVDSVLGGIFKIVGWLISGIFISFGAPFWFELLDRVVNVRGTGAKPNEV